MDEFRMELPAVAVLRDLVRKYGHSMTVFIWELAEDAAIAAGDDFISADRMRQAERDYFGRQDIPVRRPPLEWWQ